MTWAMSPAPITPTRTRVGVALAGAAVRAGRVDASMGLLLGLQWATVPEGPPIRLR
jgi:hypothetical protein